MPLTPKIINFWGPLIMFYFYLFRCKDGTLYSGSTKNLAEREKLHNSGRGSKYVKARGGGKIIYSEKFKTVGEALRREAEVKKWPRDKKINLVNTKPPRFTGWSSLKP